MNGDPRLIQKLGTMLYFSMFSLDTNRGYKSPQAAATATLQCIYKRFPEMQDQLATLHHAANPLNFSTKQKHAASFNLQGDEAYIEKICKHYTDAGWLDVLQVIHSKTGEKTSVCNSTAPGLYTKCPTAPARNIYSKALTISTTAGLTVTARPHVECVVLQELMKTATDKERELQVRILTLKISSRLAIQGQPDQHELMAALQDLFQREFKTMISTLEGSLVDKAQKAQQWVVNTRPFEVSLIPVLKGQAGQGSFLRMATKPARDWTYSAGLLTINDGETKIAIAMEDFVQEVMKTRYEKHEQHPPSPTLCTPTKNINGNHSCMTCRNTPRPLLTSPLSHSPPPPTHLQGGSRPPQAKLHPGRRPGGLLRAHPRSNHEG
jgi:hypothetical protein